eukprot:COSAG05_NODE_2120_length_3535_cov_1.493597_3_plen_110_part_00
MAVALVAVVTVIVVASDVRLDTLFLRRPRGGVLVPPPITLRHSPESRPPSLLPSPSLVAVDVTDLEAETRALLLLWVRRGFCFRCRCSPSFALVVRSRRWRPRLLLLLL